MKATSKLLTVYEAAKGERNYYSFDNFKADAKAFLKDIRKRETVCSMHVSKSGMTRKFNYRNYNMLLNICYNNKFSWDAVKVEGCGMDMHWNLQFLTCQDLATKGEIEKHNLNMLCSSGSVL